MSGFKKLLRVGFSRKLLLNLMKPVSILNRIIPKNERLVLFYDSTNQSPKDNSEALYVHMINQGFSDTYDIRWCVPANRSKMILGDVRNLNAVQGVITFLRAKYVFFSYGDMRIRPSEKQMVINLWHGMPVKRIGKMTSDADYNNERLDSFTYTLATSRLWVPVLAASFGTTEDHVLRNGLCRTDFFHYDTYRIPDLIPDASIYNCFILWMPTFRNSASGRFHDSADFSSETGLPVIDTYEKLKQLNLFCEKKGICLVVKAHGGAIIDAESFGNFFLITNEDLEKKEVFLYEFVKDFDALITDYSSIYVDYMLLDRPMGFTVDDFESYKNGRGFSLENPLDMMPGEKMNDYVDFIQFLDGVLAGRDDFEKERKRLNVIMNEDVEQSSCASLLNKIGLSGK